MASLGAVYRSPRHRLFDAPKRESESEREILQTQSSPLPTAKQNIVRFTANTATRRDQTRDIKLHYTPDEMPSPITANGAEQRIPHQQEKDLPGNANWVVQKYGGTSLGKFPTEIADDIIV